MKIKVKYFAGIRTLKGKKEEVLDIKGNTVILYLLEQIQIPQDEGRFILVNGIRQTGDYVLKEGDEVGVFPLIGGG